MMLGVNPIDRLRDAIAARDKAAQAVYDAVADAVRADVPVGKVAEVSGYHRNHVARICRERGVPDARRKH